MRWGQNIIQGVFSNLEIVKNFQFDLLCHVATSQRHDVDRIQKNQASVTSRHWISTSRRWISTSQRWLSLFWPPPWNVATLAPTSRLQLAPLSGTSRHWIYRLPGTSQRWFPTSRRCDLTLLELRNVGLNVATLANKPSETSRC